MSKKFDKKAKGMNNHIMRFINTELQPFSFYLCINIQYVDIMHQNTDRAFSDMDNVIAYFVLLLSLKRSDTNTLQQTKLILVGLWA